MSELRYRVIYGDTDQMGVMYYANYLRLFEAGRNEHLRGLGVTYFKVEQAGFFLPVTHASCRYRKSARYDDLLTLKTKVTSAKGARIHFHYEIFNEKGDLLAEGSTEHAALDKDGRVTRLPEEIVDLLAPGGA